MAFDPATNQLLLFGGCCSGFPSTLMNDTWTWDDTNRTQLTPSTIRPHRDTGPRCRSTPFTNQLVLFGGEGGPWDW